MLKFTDKFKVGDIIKAYDFEPRFDKDNLLMPECYIIGEVLETDNTEHGFRAYKVRTIVHMFGGDSLSDEYNQDAWIPHQVSFGEFDNRITLHGTKTVSEIGEAIGKNTATEDEQKYFDLMTA